MHRLVQLRLESCKHFPGALSDDSLLFRRGEDALMVLWAASGPVANTLGLLEIGTHTGTRNVYCHRRSGHQK